eukprot:7079007-Pyramimonas_sp.AAC.1
MYDDVDATMRRPESRCSHQVKLEQYLKERLPNQQAEAWHAYIALIEWAHKLFKTRDIMGDDYKVTSVFTPYIDDHMKGIIQANTPSFPGTPASESQSVTKSEVASEQSLPEQ